MNPASTPASAAVDQVERATKPGLLLLLLAHGLRRRKRRAWQAVVALSAFDIAIHFTRHRIPTAIVATLGSATARNPSTIITMPCVRTSFQCAWIVAAIWRRMPSISG